MSAKDREFEFNGMKASASEIEGEPEPKEREVLSRASEKELEESNNINALAAKLHKKPAHPSGIADDLVQLLNVASDALVRTLDSGYIGSPLDFLLRKAGISILAVITSLLSHLALYGVAILYSYDTFFHVQKKLNKGWVSAYLLIPLSIIMGIASFISEYMIHSKTFNYDRESDPNQIRAEKLRTQAVYFARSMSANKFQWFVTFYRAYLGALSTILSVAAIVGCWASINVFQFAPASFVEFGGFAFYVMKWGVCFFACAVIFFIKQRGMHF